VQGYHYWGGHLVVSDAVVSAVVTGVVFVGVTVISLVAFLGRRFDRLERNLDRRMNAVIRKLQA
jgi:UDP-N-acetylglucosamine enolpyruvyl transferase